MNLRDFKRLLENEEIAFACTYCDAHMEVRIVNAEWHLIRLGETPHEECPICNDIHERFT